MKSKKVMIALVAIGVLVIVATVFTLKNENNCDTTDSRELRLREIDRLETASIGQELTIDGYIISGYTTEYKQHGLAVFAPTTTGKYEYRTNALRYTNELVTLHTLIGQTWYDLFWANKPDLDYAEITYTVDGQAVNTMTINAQDNKILCTEAPDESYKVQYYFVDKSGTRYE